MIPSKLLVVGFSCLSLAQGSLQPKDRSVKKPQGTEDFKISRALQAPLESFCVSHFDLKGNWEFNHPFILQRERGLEECKSWDFEETIHQEVLWEVEEDDGQSYYPLEIKESELENQTHPHRSVNSRIMAQYRKDLGFSPVESFDEPQASATEVMEFVSCLTQEPTRWNEEKQREKLNEVIEAYSFLKYLGLITAEITCEDFSEESEITSVTQFKKYFKKELDMFTALNWDYLDLTPFEYQYFPISDKITSSGSIETVSPPLMMPVSIAILGRNLTNIKFHNPRTLEGRKMLLFQRLYRRYHKALRSVADKLYIDWTHCVATNWPESVSQLDLYQWSDEDVVLLNRLLDNGTITFEKASSSKKQTKSYKMLGQKDIFSSKKPIKVNFDSIKGNECVLSDDEDICGKASSYYSREAMTEVIDLSTKQLDVDKANYERRHKLVFNAEKTEKKPFNIQKPSSKSTSIVVKSEAPADPFKRRQVLARALDIFRKNSGKTHADQIDWSLTNLSVLQNHLLPFSPDFESEGDVLTLEKLMKSSGLKFNNLDMAKGRANNLYQILYKKYSAAVGFGADEYFIRWKDIEISGFPEKVTFEFNKWTRADIEAIKSCLDRMTFIAKVRHDRGIISNYSVETSGPVSASFSDFVSPNFSDLLKPTTPTERKKRIVKRKFVEDAPLLSSEALDPRIEERQLDSVNGFGDLTPEELNLLVFRLNGTLQKFKAARADQNINDRSRRIISEIIRGLNLLLDHTNNEMEAPLVSVQDIRDFVSFCRNYLPFVGSDGSMDEADVREFVVHSIRFRAILFGADPISEKNRRKQLNISKSMISDFDLFSSLLSPESHWDIDVLEHFLDNEDTPIFTGKKSKRGGSKRIIKEI